MLAFLGPRGTYTERAAAFFQRLGLSEGASTRPFPSLTTALDAVEQGAVTCAVLPLENSIEGSILVTLDRLAVSPLMICAEVTSPIRHAVFATEAVDPASVKEVRSKAEALAQCRKTLHRLFPTAQHIEMDSTATAIVYTAHAGDPAVVCVGALEAGTDAGLTVLLEDAQDVSDNATRFGLIARASAPVQVPVGASGGARHLGDKTSLLLTLGDDHPGALYEVLRAFAKDGVNLSRLESRPTRRGLGSYQFYIDALGRHDEEPLAGVLEEIRGISGFVVRDLGCYPCFAV